MEYERSQRREPSRSNRPTQVLMVPSSPVAVEVQRTVALVHLAAEHAAAVQEGDPPGPRRRPCAEQNAVGVEPGDESITVAWRGNIEVRGALELPRHEDLPVGRHLHAEQDPVWSGHAVDPSCVSIRIVRYDEPRLPLPRAELGPALVEREGAFSPTDDVRIPIGIGRDVGGRVLTRPADRPCPEDLAIGVVAHEESIVQTAPG